jgi:HPt (histidine-containing phosphotransfer) domain-containing protein
MTAHVLSHQVAALAEAGMQDHIGKPFQRDALFALVEQWATSKPTMPDLDGFQRDTFNAIAEAVGPQVIDRMLAKLAKELEGRLGADGSVLERGTVAFDAHALVSSLGSLGFDSIVAQCRVVENACRAGGEYRDELARLHDLRRKTLQQIAALRAA